MKEKEGVSGEGETKGRKEQPRRWYCTHKSAGVDGKGPGKD